MAGFTITGGVSFSGAFSLSDAPPPDNTAAWFGGGYNSTVGIIYSRVDRITFATDTATATTRGPLSTTRKGSMGATGMYSDGWFGGGQNSNSSKSSRVDRITYATDTATASVRGPLSVARASLAAAGNLTDGWFGGSGTSTVDRITYATDTATASVRGPLSGNRGDMAAAGNSTNGWFGGGPPPSPGTAYSSLVDRITYATDTATASVRGPLSLGRTGLGATGNSEYGWFASGLDYVGVFFYKSTVDRITYANDTATASVRGPLNMYQGGKTNMGAAGDPTAGWFGGGMGHNSSLSLATFSLVDRITYATDTATASTRGPLSVARRSLAAAGGFQ